MSYVTQRSPLPVLGHVAVAVEDVIITWGGYTTAHELLQQGFMTHMESYLDPKVIWLYDTEYRTWHSVMTDGDSPLGTSGAGAVIINHFMYIFGGYTSLGNSNDIYRLDMNTMKWTHLHCDKKQQPSPRDKFMCCCYEEKLYIFGGFGPPLHGYLNDNGSFLSDDEQQGFRGWNNQLLVYDTACNSWSNPKCTGSVPSPRAAGAVARLGHQLYLLGGRHDSNRLSDLHLLNLHSLEWTRLQTHGVGPCGRSWHSLSAVSDSHIVLYGGYTQEQKTMGDMWMLDVNSLEWQQIELTTEAHPRLWHTALFTKSQDLVIYGGCSNDILSTNTMAKSHNDVFVQRFSPDTLLRLSLHAAHNNRDALETEFISLPKVLQIKLQRRKGSDTKTSSDNEHHTTTCTVS